MFKENKIFENNISNPDKQLRLEQIIKDLKELGYDDVATLAQEKLNSFNENNNESQETEEFLDNAEPLKSDKKDLDAPVSPEVLKDIEEMEELVKEKLSKKIRIEDSSGDHGYDALGEVDSNNNIVNLKRVGKEYKNLSELLSSFDEFSKERPDKIEHYETKKLEYQQGALKAIQNLEKQNEQVRGIAEITKSLIANKDSVMQELKRGGREEYEDILVFIFMSPDHFADEAKNHTGLFNYLYGVLMDKDEKRRQEFIDEFEKLVSNSK